MDTFEISVFIENRPREVAKVARILGDNDINIRGMAVLSLGFSYDAMRMIVDNPEKAGRVLKERGYVVVPMEVIAVEIEDEPTGLAMVAEILANKGFNIEYLYSCGSKKEGSITDILRITRIDDAAEVLRSAGVKVLTRKELHPALENET